MRCRLRGVLQPGGPHMLVESMGEEFYEQNEI